MAKELKELLPNFLEGETEWKEVDKHINQIVDLLFKKNIIFLCGAGLSKKSGYELFAELAEDMIRDVLDIDRKDDTKDALVRNLAKEFPSEAIADVYLKETDRTRLRRFLEDRLQKEGVEPHEGHRVFSFLASEKLLNRLYTTNFDDLIRHALGERAQCVTDQNISDFDSIIEGGRIAVIHLHGRIQKGANTNLLVTEGETYALKTPLSYLFRVDLLKNWVVFLGYSMGDQDLKSIYFYTRDLMRKTGFDKKIYVVLCFENHETERWRIANAMWQARDAILIPMKAEEFLVYLQGKIKYKQYQKIVDVLAKRLEISVGEVQERIERIQNQAPGLEENMAIKSLVEYENVDLEDLS